MEIQKFICDFADQFDDTDVSEFKAESVIRDFDEWSSMTGLAILNMVEKEYGVSLSFDELRSAITIHDLFETVEKKVN